MDNGISTHARRLFPYLIILFLAFVFFSPFFVEGKAFLAADTLYTHYPWKSFVPWNFHPHNTLITDPVNGSYAAQYNSQLKHGAPSKWNPLTLTGLPGARSISMGTPGRFYPIKLLLHRILPAYAASALMFFIHVALMGIFMHMYLLEIGAGRRGALFGAIAYMFNGCAMVWLEFEIWVTVSALLPLLLICMERYLSEKRFLYSVAAGGVLGLMFMTGSTQLNIYVGVLMIFYLLLILVRSYRRGRTAGDIAAPLFCFASTIGLGLLIGAIELFPFMELVSSSSRVNRTFDFSGFFDSLSRVPLRYFMTLFFPDFFGNPVLYLNIVPRLSTQEYMNYNELAMYAGVPTMFAVAAGIVARKNSSSRFYLFFAVLVAAMFTGTYAYYPFFKLVPGMNKLNPSRLIFLFVFAVSVVAAMGIRGLEDLTPGRARILTVIFLVMIAGVSAVAFWGSSPGVTAWFNREAFIPLLKENEFYFNRIIQLRGITSQAIYKPLALGLASFFLFMCLVLMRRKKAAVYLFYAILLLLSFDLITFGREYNTTISPKYVYPKTPAIDFLLARPRPFRVVQDTGHGFYFNALAPFGIEDVAGYDSLYADRISALMSYVRFGDLAFRGVRFDRWVSFEDFGSPLFDMMNVQYVLLPPNSLLSDPKFRLVYNREISIYENTHVMPRAYVVHKYSVRQDVVQILRYMGSDSFDMRNEVVLEEEPGPDFRGGVISPSAGFPSSERGASIDRYTPDEVVITAELSSPGWLVLTDTFYPGWQAEIDNKKAKIYRANCNFRAVPLTAGKHSISFSYRSSVLRNGMILTAIGALLTCGGLVFFSRRRKSSG